MAADHEPTVNDTNAEGNEIPPAPEQPPAPPTEPEQQQPEQMNIKFTNAQGNTVSFRLKGTTKLKKAMDVYSARMELQRGTLRFLYDGERVLDENTPAQLDMTDGDAIEVYTEQIGG